MELLRVEQNPQQVMSPHSSSKLLQNIQDLGTATPAPKPEGGTDAKAESELKSEDSALTPASRIEVLCESYSEIKEEDESVTRIQDSRCQLKEVIHLEQRKKGPLCQGEVAQALNHRLLKISRSP